jgi:uncharacterized protein with ATP-grasp and redox domains
METYYDCLPCFIRQTLDAVRLVTPDEEIHETVIRRVLRAVSEIDFTKSPPVMGQFIHRLIREISACDDPYKHLKVKYNQYALGLYPAMKEKIQNASNQFETAVRLAIAGNIIDFGANLNVDHSVITNTIDSSLTDRLIGNVEYLYQGISSAEKILYIGDNTGEIVFDRLLIEQLPLEKVIFAVRGMPILNDATMEDAIETGMTDFVRVIHNGSDAPGTVLEECSPEFRQIFTEADLIISKGQGNFETLSDVDENLVFLLKAKCPVIADHIGCEVGDSIVGRIQDF